MNRLFSITLIIVMIFTTILVSPAIAEDLTNGAKIFSANCAACHAGGNNLVNAAKTLKKSDLEKYEMASLEAIKTQVTHGKAAMPAFGGRLNSQQIEDVAAYVLDRADAGW